MCFYAFPHFNRGFNGSFHIYGVRQGKSKEVNLFFFDQIFVAPCKRMLENACLLPVSYVAFVSNEVAGRPHTPQTQDPVAAIMRYRRAAIPQ